MRRSTNKHGQKSLVSARKSRAKLSTSKNSFWISIKRYPTPSKVYDERLNHLFQKATKPQPTNKETREISEHSS